MEDRSRLTLILISFFVRVCLIWLYCRQDEQCTSCNGCFISENEISEKLQYHFDGRNNWKSRDPQITNSDRHFFKSFVSIISLWKKWWIYELLYVQDFFLQQKCCYFKLSLWIESYSVKYVKFSINIERHILKRDFLKINSWHLLIIYH